MFSCLGRIIKVVFQIAIVGGLIVGGIVLVNDLGILSSVQTGSSPDSDFGIPNGEVSSEPNDEHIVKAVQSSLNGKTYKEFITKNEPKWRTCTEYDVALDPYAKNNPELAKCPHAGKRYRESNFVTVVETKKCAPIPEAGLQVVSLGNDQWQAIYGGNRWTVTKLDGSQTSAGEIIEISISNFRFQVNAHQDC